MHDTRKYITGEIAKLERVTVIYVISDKKTTPKDHAIFYNTVAALTLERILRHSEKQNKKVSVWWTYPPLFPFLFSLPTPTPCSH